ncbi:DUF1778 domain-containing protein [Streptomyces sp. ID05-26A]|nr:DUF1778 domain-containing protein [Streptomyces sp. ID05-26A]
MGEDGVVQRQPKGERINLRASSLQEQVLRQAAAVTHKTMTDFILESAVTQAERVLADRRWFMLDERQWEEFERLLDLPVQDLPKMRRLLTRESPFASDDVE